MAILKHALLIAFTAAFTIATSYSAHAGSASEAFGSLLNNSNTNVNSPGSYQTQARGVAFAGSASIRFPTSGRVNLISIRGPSISGGCHGIDAHLGSISWANADQIVQLIENTGRNMIGPIIIMGIKWLFPSLASTINDWLAKLQKALSFAADSCALATSIIGGIEDRIGASAGTQRESDAGFCRTWERRINTCDDGIDCRSACDSVGEMFTAITDSFEGASREEQEEMLESDERFANTTWLGFKSMGIVGLTREDNGDLDAHPDPYHAYVLGELLMSMIGTSMPAAITDDPGEENVPRLVARAPTMDVQTGLFIYMCGSDFDDIAFNDNNSAHVQCRKYLQNSGVDDNDGWRIYSCSGADTNSGRALDPLEGKYDCLTVEALSREEYFDRDAEAKEALAGGFLIETHRILSTAVQDVIADNEISDEAKALISTSPFPLYRALNLAALYPGVAVQIIETYSVIIASYLAQHFLVQSIDAARKHAQVEGAQQIPATIVEGMHEFIQQIDVQIGNTFEEITKHIRFVEGIEAQIQQVEASILESIYHRDLLGNGKFARDIAAGGESS